MSLYVLNKSKYKLKFKIEFDKSAKEIGVFLSGGLDSTILMYLLLSERKKQNVDINFTALTVNKSNAGKTTEHILNLLTREFGLIKHIQNIDNSGSEHGSIASAVRQQIRSHSFDLLYTGINQNPPEADFDSGIGTKPNRPLASPHPRLILPFIQMYKNHIIELGQQINAQHLFGITHSCTEKTDDACNTCFACLERAWGFAINNMTDPSIFHRLEPKQ